MDVTVRPHQHVAAVLVAVSWPWSSLWLLGMVLAIDLISQGVDPLSLYRRQ